MIIGCTVIHTRHCEYSQGGHYSWNLLEMDLSPGKTPGKS